MYNITVCVHVVSSLQSDFNAQISLLVSGRPLKHLQKKKLSKDCCMGEFLIKDCGHCEDNCETTQMVHKLVLHVATNKCSPEQRRSASCLLQKVIFDENSSITRLVLHEYNRKRVPSVHLWSNISTSHHHLISTFKWWYDVVSRSISRITIENKWFWSNLYEITDCKTIKIFVLIII